MIETIQHDGVLEIVMSNPPVNALGTELCRRLGEELSGALADDGVKAIVIRGGGRMFSGGADITQFENGAVEPALPALVEFVEASDKPVIAAIAGAALGGGLELAMACHHRLATLTATLGLPEVKLGLIPGAGGTQRLPRLVGIERALEMIAFGEPVNGTEAAAIGLVDRVVEDGDLAREAIDLARTGGVRRTAEVPLGPDHEAVARLTATHGRKLQGLDAPRAGIEAVASAGEVAFAEGLARERDAFRGLLTSEQGLGLRHAFFAERAAARIAGLPKDVATRPMGRVGIIGCGTMGGGIAMNFASKGIPVTIVEMTAEALERGMGVVRRNYEATAAKGRMTAAAAAQAIGALTGTLDLEALADCDLVIEAAYETMEVKRDIFSRLDAIARPGAILASNTSYLDIDEMAAVTSRPGDVLGLHFFSPANVMKLVEVIRGARTAPDVLATSMEIARRIGKVPVVSGVCYGFIGNRMLIPRQENATELLLEGASPEQVDRVHTAFGLPMGPFQMADLAGLDLGWHRDPTRIETIGDALCAAGRLGQKTGAGLYDYDERRRASPSPVVVGLIDEFRGRNGLEPRTIPDEEILVRTLYTMVNEGAKILEEGIAQRASDIDVVWLYGYGWPRHTGGPMFWAGRQGLQTIVSGLEKYRDRLGPDFSISPLLAQRAAAGKGFED